LNAYPSQNAKELAGFSRMALEALAGEPDSVLFALANPRTGIVSKCKFLPVIAELIEWCRNERIRQAEEDRREIIATARRLPCRPRETAKPAVVAGFRDLLQEIRSNSSPAHRELSRIEARDEAEIWLDRELAKIEAGLIAPVKVSPEALRRFSGGI
jgi:hypothetical protein